MTPSQYRKVRAGDRVRTRRAIGNGNMLIPPSTEMTVVYKHNGLDLEGPKCECCGIRPRISKVGAADVDLVTE